VSEHDAIAAEVVATITAVVERIIPSDDGWPGAREAGTVDYVLARAMLGEPPDLAALGRLVRIVDAAAAEQLERAFVDVPEQLQDAILLELEEQEEPAFARLVERTMEGFYGDPVHGGNADGVSWSMIGFPGPAGPAGGYTAPLGAYDATEPPLPDLPR
jgi:gluconate 2-dehydrogenase gamma chain